MIKVLIEADGDKLIRRLEISGHSGLGIKGQNVLCGVVSALSRAFVRTLESFSMDMEARAPSSGLLELNIKSITETDRSWYTGACRLLLRGMADLCEDFPHDLQLSLSPWGGK